MQGQEDKGKHITIYDTACAPFSNLFSSVTRQDQSATIVRDGRLHVILNCHPTNVEIRRHQRVRRTVIAIPIHRQHHSGQAIRMARLISIPLMHQIWCRWRNRLLWTWMIFSWCTTFRLFSHTILPTNRPGKLWHYGRSTQLSLASSMIFSSEACWLCQHFTRVICILIWKQNLT